MGEERKGITIGTGNVNAKKCWGGKEKAVTLRQL